MTFLIIEVSAPTEELRDKALLKARSLEGKGVKIISLGENKATNPYFFSFIVPDDASPAAAITGAGSPNPVQMDILFEIKIESSMKIGTI